MKFKRIAWLLVVLLAGVAMVFIANRPLRNTPRQSELPTDSPTDEVVASEAASESAAANFVPTNSRERLSPFPRPVHAAEFDAIAKVTDDGQRRRQLDKLFQKWVIEDAPGAAEFVLTVENEDARKEAMLRVMQTWGTQDANAALTWAVTAKFDNDYEREVAMSMVCSQVARTDPPEALRLALDHKLDETADGLFEGLMARWAESDLPAARDWVFALPEGARRDRLVESIALVLFGDSPTKATRLILDQIPAGERQDQAILTMVNRLAAQNPERAQQWVASFPEGELRERALNNLDGIINRQSDEE